MDDNSQKGFGKTQSKTNIPAKVHQFEQALLSLDRLAAERVLIDLSDSSVTPSQYVEQIIVPALDHIGSGWEQGEIALSQVYISGRICEELLGKILPSGRQSLQPHPKMAIAVLQDHHQLGKRIVHSVLRASGFELIDYGAGITVNELVDRIKRDEVQVLLISVLMLSSALLVEDVRLQLDRADLDTTIIIGGAPFRFDENLGQEVGAHHTCLNATEGVELVTRLAGIEK